MKKSKYHHVWQGVVGLKKNVLTVILISLVGIGFLFPDELRIVSRGENLTVLRNGAQVHHLSFKNAKDAKGIVVDTIFYYQQPADDDNYDDFIAGYQGTGESSSDTCINWFTLLAPGKIRKLFMQNEKSGTATWRIWAPAIDPESQDYLFPGQTGINTLFSATHPSECQAQNPSAQFLTGVWSPVWNVLDLTAEYQSEVSIDEDNLDFWVGYTMDELGGPTIWQDGYAHDSETEGACRSFSTLNGVTPGKWYRNIESGDSRKWIAHIMQIEVVYEQLPPIISDVSQFSDTYDKRKNVMAKIIELENQTLTPLLNYKYHNNDAWLTKSMTSTQEDTFFAALDANPGDSVYYFVSAEDETGLRAESDVNYYVVLAPPEDRTVLVVKDNPWAIDSLYTQAFDSVGCSYLFWDAGVHRGIDSSVIHCPQFSMIAVFGCRSKIVPLLDSTSADPCDFRKYLQNGGGLMLADMDYFYGWGMPTSGRFSDGDFAYDYLGIGTYENDPDDSITVAGGTADIEMIGVADDSLTDSFSATNAYGPLRFDLIGGKSENWSDYVVPGNGGISIFKGTVSNKDMAIRKEDEKFRTLFFSCPIELSPASEFRVLMQNVIQWLEDRPVKIEPETAIASRIELLTNYPNPFNATTRIRYRLVTEGLVRICIYDIKGNLVKTLVNERKEAGLYELNWNGVDRFGHSVASGVYFLKIESEHSTRNRKILLVR